MVLAAQTGARAEAQCWVQSAPDAEIVSVPSWLVNGRGCVAKPFINPTIETPSGLVLLLGLPR